MIPCHRTRTAAQNVTGPRPAETGCPLALALALLLLLQSSIDHVLVAVGDARRPCRPRMCCCCCCIHPTLSHTLSFDRPRTPMRQAHARVRPA